MDEQNEEMREHAKRGRPRKGSIGEPIIKPIKSEKALQKSGVPINNAWPILEYLANNRIAQIEFADEAGIARAHFNRLLNKQALTSLRTIERIADKIGVPWWELLLPEGMVVVTQDEANFLKGINFYIEKNAKNLTSPADSETPRDE